LEDPKILDLLLESSRPLQGESPQTESFSE